MFIASLSVYICQCYYDKKKKGEKKLRKKYKEEKKIIRNNCFLFSSHHLEKFCSLHRYISVYISVCRCYYEKKEKTKKMGRKKERKAKKNDKK